MRAIMFRGKNLKGEWIYGDLLHNRGETFIAPDGVANPLATAKDFQIDSTTVGQFTGLLDKNGKEIWEGDIMRIRNQYDEDWVSEVYDCGVVDVHDCEYDLTVLVWMEGYYDFEVIGNIHDNPELLKSK